MDFKKDMVVCNLEYFTLGKDIIVVKNGSSEHVKCENIDKLPKLIYNICKERKIDDIALSGAREYTQKISYEIQQLEIQEFQYSRLNIILI